MKYPQLRLSSVITIEESSESGCGLFLKTAPDIVSRLCGMTVDIEGVTTFSYVTARIPYSECHVKRKRKRYAFGLENVANSRIRTPT